MNVQLLCFFIPQLYELSSGRLLCSFLFDFGLTKVTMDLAEHRLFVGGSTGKIAQVNLFLQVREFVILHKLLHYNLILFVDIYMYLLCTIKAIVCTREIFACQVTVSVLIN